MHRRSASEKGGVLFNKREKAAGRDTNKAVDPQAEAPQPRGTMNSDTPSGKTQAEAPQPPVAMNNDTSICKLCPNGHRKADLTEFECAQKWFTDSHKAKYGDTFPSYCCHCDKEITIKSAQKYNPITEYKVGARKPGGKVYCCKEAQDHTKDCVMLLCTPCIELAPEKTADGGMYLEEWIQHSKVSSSERAPGHTQPTTQGTSTPSSRSGEKRIRSPTSKMAELKEAESVKKRLKVV